MRRLIPLGLGMGLLCVAACDGLPPEIEVFPVEKQPEIHEARFRQRTEVTLRAEHDATARQVWERQEILIRAGVSRVEVTSSHPST